MRFISGLTLVTAAAILLPVSAFAKPQHWVRSWEAVPVELQTADAKRASQPLKDVTFRTVARISAGGPTLRLRLSNELSDTALRIGAVHVALAGSDGAIVKGSDRTVTFATRPTALIPAYSPLMSDPVALKVPALAKLVVSIYAPEDASTATVHPLGVTTTDIVPGDQTASEAVTGGRKTTVRYILSGIDVTAEPSAGTIVAFGDSITDGARSTDNANQRWPDILAERLKAAGMSNLAVANAGISGNRLMATGAGPAAVARFDRDVLSVPGAKYLIVLEGINDIGSAKNRQVPPPGAEEITAIYQQMIDRAHDHGIKVFGATILPYKGAGYRSEEGDAVRQSVNAWIRAPGHFDAVIDLDKTMGDKADPLTMAAAYDSGDHLHPKDAGYRVMAEAIDLKLFR